MREILIFFLIIQIAMGHDYRCMGRVTTCGTCLDDLYHKFAQPVLIDTFIWISINSKFHTNFSHRVVELVKHFLSSSSLCYFFFLPSHIFLYLLASLQAQLELIMSANGLSENVYEIASKSLAA